MSWKVDLQRACLTDKRSRGHERRFFFFFFFYGVNQLQIHERAGLIVLQANRKSREMSQATVVSLSWSKWYQ